MIELIQHVPSHLLQQGSSAGYPVRGIPSEDDLREFHTRKRLVLRVPRLDDLLRQVLGPLEVLLASTYAQQGCGGEPGPQGNGIAGGAEELFGTLGAVRRPVVLAKGALELSSLGAQEIGEVQVDLGELLKSHLTAALQPPNGTFVAPFNLLEEQPTLLPCDPLCDPAEADSERTLCFDGAERGTLAGR
ncbi:hypothetical protein HUW63_06230 [Myxococcus sp. AM001]|nr:hypothetical protein [Myxococcus sp. AM001]